MNVRQKLLRSVGAASAAGLVMAAAVTAGPAASAVEADAAVAASKTLNYTCSNGIVDGALGGPPTLSIKMTTKLPKKVKAGTKIKASALQANPTLPVELVGLLQTLQQTHVAGYSSDIALLVKKGKAKPAAVKVNKYRIPNTALPASPEALTLNGKGKLAGFKAQNKKGAIKVSAPKLFNFVAVLTPGTEGDGESEANLECTLDKGQNAVLQTVKVTKPKRR
jgi:hypothetical protein